MEHKQQSSHFLNGFIIGLLVGVGITLLFTTKKGRRILRALSEEGLDKVSNLDELLKKFEHVAEQAVSGAEEPESEEEAEATDYVPPRKVLLAASVDTPPKKVTMPKVQINSEERTEPKTQDAAPVEKAEIRDALAIALEKIDEDFPVEEEEENHKVKPTRRRFFRGIPKRG